MVRWSIVDLVFLFAGFVDDMVEAGVDVHHHSGEKSLVGHAPFEQLIRRRATYEGSRIPPARWELE